jgi:subtilisin family serine protease
MIINSQRFTILSLLSFSLLTLAGVTDLKAQSESASYTPNAISLFWPGTNAGAAPGYFGEWELQNNMPVVSGTNAGLDVNIAGAWSNGFTGRGVTIAIVDDGVEGTHPDLNYANDLSWDFTKNSYENQNFPDFLKRGFPATPDDVHGTECAGVAAGIGYGIGVVGAAPHARISSLRHTLRNDVPIPTVLTNAKIISEVLTFEGQKNRLGQIDPSISVNWSNPIWTNGAPIRVKSHSYLLDRGSGGYLTFFSPSDRVLKEAFDQCEQNGIINVFCAGNIRYQAGIQDANRQQILSHVPNLIVVGALASHGKFAFYSSFGANLFVTAPSNDPKSPWNLADGLYSIATTDLLGIWGDNKINSTNSNSYKFESLFTNSLLYNYYSSFGGTSSSTPLVSGIMALGIEADPYLTPRMAQHLLALTSRQVDPTDNFFGGLGWVTNSGGYRYDLNYGFGLIDATAFTTAAAYVYDYQLAGGQPLTQQHTNITSITPNNTFFVQENNKTNAISISLNVTNKFPQLTTEYVQVGLQISGFETNLNSYTNGHGAIPGDISGFLISPSGTTNMLFANDNNVQDITTRGAISVIHNGIDGGILNWTYLSYAYYGENPNGKWTLLLNNKSTNSIYTKNLQIKSVVIATGVGAFDTNCLQGLIFANGTNQVAH